MSTLSQPCLQTKNLNLSYGGRQVLYDVNLTIPKKKVTALIGPSGCGKSSLLRCFNRMNDLIPDCLVEGSIMFQGHNILAPDFDPMDIRYRIGMVFQKANPFPKSIFDNVAFGLTINGLTDALADRVETALKKASLWEETKDRLHKSALGLSGGQQQRLCIARAIALEPEVLLLDEPCSSLDPISTEHIESLIHTLKKDHTVMIVTHNMQQAVRVSDTTAFMLQGKLIEVASTPILFSKPSITQTRDYVTGRFG